MSEGYRNRLNYCRREGKERAEECGCISWSKSYSLIRTGEGRKGRFAEVVRDFLAKSQKYLSVKEEGGSTRFLGIKECLT